MNSLSRLRRPTVHICFRFKVVNNWTIRNVEYFHMTSRQACSETSVISGVPNQSCGKWILFLCRHFLLLQWICTTAEPRAWLSTLHLEIYTPCSYVSNTVLSFECSISTCSNHGKFSNLSSNRRWMDAWKIRWRFGFENACVLHSPSKVIVRLYHEFSDETGWRFRGNISQVRWVLKKKQ